MKQFSTEDLIAEIYNENSDHQSDVLQEALNSNWALQEKKAVIEEAISILQGGWQHPRAAIIQSILAYAERSAATAAL